MKTRIQKIKQPLVSVVLSLGLSLLAHEAGAKEERFTEVRVQSGQTLNAALAGVEGAVVIHLPPGVTEHGGPITREATVILRGAGREASTLRPAADVPLIDQGDVMEPFEGDLVLEDFTYDRAHRHVEADHRSIVRTNAGGDLIFRNFRTHRFNWDGKRGYFLRGVGDHRLHTATPDSPRHRYVGFHNFEIDYAYDGGIRNRPHGRTGSGQLRFNAQRFVFDGDSLFRGHLMQHALPEHTVGEGSRGPAPLGAFRFNVWDYGLLDGEIREVDYSVVRHGAVQTRDGVLEIRAHCPENGFADQFWPRAYLEGPNGHLIYDGVHLSAADGNLWDDRGFKANGDWKSITVRNCFISGYDAPIDFASGQREGQTEQGTVTITDTDIWSRGYGVDIGNLDVSLEGVFVSNLNIRAHPDSETGFFRQAVLLRERGDSPGSFMMVSNVRADGYLSAIVNDSISPNSTLVTENLQGRQAESPMVEDASPVASIPREPLPWDATREELEAAYEPVATLEDFGDNPEGFSRLDVYMSHADEGVYLFVVKGTDSLSNEGWDMNNMWRGDAVQFAITEGMPGEHPGYVLLDLARHDQHGPLVFQRNHWPDRDLPHSDGVVKPEESEIEFEVEFDADEGEAIYRVLLPWENIGLPAPWYDYLSVDLAATRGETYPSPKGTQWPSPYESVKGETGIFHAPDLPTRAFKAIECE